MYGYHDGQGVGGRLVATGGKGGGGIKGFGEGGGGLGAGY